MSNLDVLNDVFRAELDDDNLNIMPDMSKDDFPNWDSLAHVRIIAAIEERFDFQFSLSQIEEVDTVGGLLDIVAAHQA